MNKDWFEVSDSFQVDLILTIAVIILFLVTQQLIARLVRRNRRRYKFGPQRQKIILNAINLTFIGVAIIAIMGIWGLEGSQILAYLTSVLAVLGVAFFASWSILSNITAGIILFFNHPLKLGDYIKIMEGDPQFEGYVEDITFYFLHLKTKEGIKLTMPNNVALQKTITILESSEGNA